VVIRRAGGKTQVVSLINAGLVFLTLLFVLPLFFKLPNATLSAVVIQAMLGLLNFAYLRKLFRIDRSEFAYAMAALFGVLVLGILQGVALGVVLALVLLIRRVSRPTTAVLGRLPGTDAYRDITLTPVQEVLVPAQQINQLDSTGANQLERLWTELEAKGISLSFAEVKSTLREAMHRTDLEERIGADRIYESIHEGVQAFLQGQDQIPGGKE
jgi:MFS superfamily sulfate permease-like transporter